MKPVVKLTASVDSFGRQGPKPHTLLPSITREPSSRYADKVKFLSLVSKTPGGEKLSKPKKRRARNDPVSKSLAVAPQLFTGNPQWSVEPAIHE